MKRPPVDQLRAVIGFAALNGMTWKAGLRHAWETCDYPADSESAALQRLRNEFGPSWLKRHSLNDIKQMIEPMTADARPFEDHTYADMAITIGVIRHEIKERNPIGVNMYTPYLDQAIAAMWEISAGEAHNFTSESGPREKKL